MFCNKCGKTLNPEATSCPSCGQPVGDSRFEGSGYTSSQVRFVPAGAEQSGYAPYTKTTYSSMPDENGDVYSRTNYRPALAKDEGGETTGPRESEPAGNQAEPESGPESGPEVPAAEPEAQPEAHGKAQHEQPKSGEEYDALGIAIKPLEPIKKTGISPEVQRYIQQMNHQKTRKQRKAPGAADERGEEGAPSEEAPEAGPDALPGARAGAGRWIVRIAGVLVVVALLVAGVLYVSYQTANRAKIPAVTYTLYTEGLSLIKTHATTEYREGIIRLWRADTSGKAAMTQQQTEREQITALLPEKPLDNDQLFVDTLMAIQDSIENATATDAVAALSATNGNTTLSSLSDASEEIWTLINNAITRLDSAAEPAELNAIISGVDLSTIPTPEPEATATPAPYKTLKKGMKNNRQVKNLQDRLYKLGWFNGVRDGDFGPATQTAVKKFQKAAGLKEDGIATVDMQVLLYADDAPRGDGRTAAATPAAGATAETPAPDAAVTPAPEGGELPSA